jgi:hypothetical protein
MYIAKNNNILLTVRLGSGLNQTVTLPGITLNSNSNPLIVNNLSQPILGYVSSLDVSNSLLSFSLDTEPLSRHPYNWLYINDFAYKNLEFEQWVQYT